MAGHTAVRKPSARTSGGSDAVAYLKAQHREVESLFKRFSQTGERAYKTRRRLVDQMIVALSHHAFIEEHVLYPAARDEVDSAHEEVLEALEEHHIVKWQLKELDGLDPADERFGAKVNVMMENVRHHVREEEGELFPLLRTVLGRRRLMELGDELRAVQSDAPDKPHPRWPDEPLDRLAPDHLVPDAVSGTLDRARDMVKSVRRSA